MTFRVQVASSHKHLLWCAEFPAFATHYILWLAPLFSVMPFFARKRHYCILSNTSVRFSSFSLSDREASELDANILQAKHEPKWIKKSKRTYLHQSKEFQRKSCHVKLLSIAPALPCFPHPPHPAICILEYFTFSSWPVGILLSSQIPA